MQFIASQGFIVCCKSQVIAAAGVASKRASEAIVQAGDVKVNGKVVLHPGQPVIASVDEVLSLPPKIKMSNQQSVSNAYCKSLLSSRLQMSIFSLVEVSRLLALILPCIQFYSCDLHDNLLQALQCQSVNL